MHMMEVLKWLFVCRRNIEKSSFDWKLKELVPVLIVESDWMAPNLPPRPTISPNTSNRNFEIAILFNLVERSRNYVLEGDILPLQPSGQGL